MGDYAGRTVVITGAASGLGEAMADAFAREGAKLALLDIDGDRGKAKAAQFRQIGTEALAFQTDISDKATLHSAADTVEARLGGCDVLCANVGVQQFGAIDALTDHDWSWVMSVNFFGTVNTVGAFLPLLRRRAGPRHIVLTASASVFQLGARMAAYVASKFALTGYGEVLRQELAEEGINVALLFPAGMATRHLETSVAARPKRFGPSRLEAEDIEVMMASAGITSENHVATAEHAVRSLIADLRAGHPYIFTHGQYRHHIADRQDEILAAFDRMAAA